METKTCTQCNQELPTERFYVGTQRGSKGQVWRYFDSFCKTCRCRYQTERRQKIKRQAVEYLGGKCQRCGLKTDRVVAYDFHHKDPNEKDFMISKQAKSFKSIKGELDKCELLCAICHRFEHEDSGSI